MECKQNLWEKIVTLFDVPIFGAPVHQLTSNWLLVWLECFHYTGGKFENINEIFVGSVYSLPVLSMIVYFLPCLVLVFVCVNTLFREIDFNKSEWIVILSPVWWWCAIQVELKCGRCALYSNFRIRNHKRDYVNCLSEKQSGADRSVSLFRHLSK